MNTKEFEHSINVASDHIATAMAIQSRPLRSYEIKSALTALAQAFRVEPSQPTIQQSESLLEPTRERRISIRYKTMNNWCRENQITEDWVLKTANSMVAGYADCHARKIARFAAYAVDAIEYLEQELDHYQYLAKKDQA